MRPRDHFVQLDGSPPEKDSGGVILPSIRMLEPVPERPISLTSSARAAEEDLEDRAGHKSLLRAGLRGPDYVLGHGRNYKIKGNVKVKVKSNVVPTPWDVKTLRVCRGKCIAPVSTSATRAFANSLEVDHAVRRESFQPLLG